MEKGVEAFKRLSKNKALYRLLYDVCVVTFITVVTSEHMITHSYSFGRMCRFWTMWSCWSCLLYFFVAFCKQVALLLFPVVKKTPRSMVMSVLVDAVQQTAVVLCLCVTGMFWYLYFKSPSAVFRVDDGWQPSLMEELFVTHFEHSFPLLFLLVDCFVFAQGNKRVVLHYKASKYIPLCAFCSYSALALHDFFRYQIRPYPFMDKWNLTPILLMLIAVASLIQFVLNPVAYYIRKSLF
ncbi:hypothetical protein EIN_153190 [Entamoeba invadens IP1]|uniref:Uncharacterized protein n=1 Tax=Entamoeba invadens IP1 TaxID=370355 RepID=A0A0A1U8Y6_ENTIV|nr:hypothetical protein EIN_153190 [Entamoeba invadens IP1]ELP91312.1 hypothetical protein EIN_153190 [Entamoeba invadens IP1]|eukprot:XP_004258083.1 hypothetical protein EIN_153190 [Entamoeba invadens IP1]